VKPRVTVPGWRARSLSALVTLLFAALACSPKPAGPTLGGETNWLSLCNSDADCAGSACICGSCSKSCEDATCPSGTTCFAAGAAELTACGETSVPAACLATCEAKAECPPGFDCGGGICRPADVPAFPGAEGFAGRIRGGRGGRVLRVTSLSASGEGTLQAALDTPGARIIVFDVSGVIEADLLELTHGDVTIAGQTAPGGGITLRGRLHTTPDAEVRNVILRHLRVRPVYDGSEPLQFDAIRLSPAREVLLDHVSAAFAVDDTVDLFDASRVTVQWSTIESSLAVSLPAGDPYQGLVVGSGEGQISLHHNLFVHHQDDNPSIAGGPAEVLGNVVYDALHGFSHHGEASGAFDLVGNTFIAGPSSVLRPFYFDDETSQPDPELAYYLADNHVAGVLSECGEGALDDPWSQCSYELGRDASFRADEPFDRAPWPAHVPVTLEPAAATAQRVLERAGAFPRDAVTQSLLDDVRTLGGEWGAEYPGDLLAGLTPGDALEDGDGDGMPDAWERGHGLDPADPDDANRARASGYTAIEDYINERAAALLSE
jgi:hypothetical protein